MNIGLSPVIFETDTKILYKLLNKNAERTILLSPLRNFFSAWKIRLSQLTLIPFVEFNLDVFQNRIQGKLAGSQKYKILAPSIRPLDSHELMWKEWLLLSLQRIPLLSVLTTEDIKGMQCVFLRLEVSIQVGRANLLKSVLRQGDWTGLYHVLVRLRRFFT